MNFFACPRRLSWKHSALLLVLAAASLYTTHFGSESSRSCIFRVILLFSRFSRFCLLAGLPYRAHTKTGSSCLLLLLLLLIHSVHPWWYTKMELLLYIFDYYNFTLNSRLFHSKRRKCGVYDTRPQKKFFPSFLFCHHINLTSLSWTLVVSPYSKLEVNVYTYSKKSISFNKEEYFKTPLNNEVERERNNFGTCSEGKFSFILRKKSR